MKRSFKPVCIAAVAAILAAGCGSPNLAVNAEPITIPGELSLKNEKLSEDQLKGWGHTDIVRDTVPGMSIEKSYTEIIQDNPGKPVIVAVLDSGVDIEHEDLDGVIWTNEDEIAGNGIDDDKNGYVDDIHGWNFLGDAVGENMEFVRILKKLKPKYGEKDASDISAENQEEFALYRRAMEEYEKEHGRALQNKNRYSMILQRIQVSQEAVAGKLGKETFTKQELKNMQADTPELQQYQNFLLAIMAQAGNDLGEIEKQLNEGIDYYSNRLDTHFNMQFNGRLTGDDVNDLTDTGYGNNDVDGPTEDEKDATHGTHVAGIIAAERNNGIGINGVANNVKLMVLRAVPDGDEYDKDVALAIRYAVDNGAKVINASFGKYYSTHPDWVNEAIQYAAEHDVLIVRAAGNDAYNLDETRVYPNDQWPENTDEIADNFLTVGALNYEYGEGLVAGFSNYGDTSVDVFAPGMKIWSTVPQNEYEFLQGTSMASPGVAGIAAIIRSYYPKLSAAQVKQIIMNSGVPLALSVEVGGSHENIQTFDMLSTSGKIANLYNALILADTIAK